MKCLRSFPDHIFPVASSIQSMCEMTIELEELLTICIRTGAP